MRGHKEAARPGSTRRSLEDLTAFVVSPADSVSPGTGHRIEEATLDAVHQAVQVPLQDTWAAWLVSAMYEAASRPTTLHPPVPKWTRTSRALDIVPGGQLLLLLLWVIWYLWSGSTLQTYAFSASAGTGAKLRLRCLPEAMRRHLRWASVIVVADKLFMLAGWARRIWVGGPWRYRDLAVDLLPGACEMWLVTDDHDARRVTILLLLVALGNAAAYWRALRRRAGTNLHTLPLSQRRTWYIQAAQTGYTHYCLAALRECLADDLPAEDTGRCVARYGSSLWVFVLTALLVFHCAHTVDEWPVASRFEVFWRICGLAPRAQHMQPRLQATRVQTAQHVSWPSVSVPLMLGYLLLSFMTVSGSLDQQVRQHMCFAGFVWWVTSKGFATE